MDLEIISILIAEIKDLTETNVELNNNLNRVIADKIQLKDELYKLKAKLQNQNESSNGS